MTPTPAITTCIQIKGKVRSWAFEGKSDKKEAKDKENKNSQMENMMKDDSDVLRLRRADSKCFVNTGLN